MLKKILLAVITFAASIGMAVAAVNINTATEQELQSLPGVGPAKAKAIVEYRQANGNFRRAEDIKNVKGIGDGLYKQMKDQISTSGTTRIDARADAKAGRSGDGSLKESTKDAAATVKDKAGDLKEAAKEKTRDAVAATKEKAREVKEASKEKAQDAKAAVKNRSEEARK